MTVSIFKAVSHTTRFFILTSLVIALTSLAGFAQTLTSFDSGTPAESKGGLSGHSTYAQDKIETVNLANGNLNLHIPLVTVGGRGSASYTVALNYNSKVWSGRTDTETQGGVGGEPPQTIQHYTAIFDDLTGKTPNAFYIGGGWSILKSPAIKVKLSDIEALHPATCPGIQGVTLYKYGLTKVWLVLPDGSEIEMRDAATDGAPHLRPTPCTQQTDGDRGRVWRSVDGSAITYITDADNGVVTGQLGGFVFFPDGTRLTITGTTAGGGGRCTKMIDRNGNVLDFIFNGSTSVTYVDQLGRQVIVQGGAAGVTVTVKGHGIADRSFTIETGQVAPEQDGPPAPNLRDDYQNWDRPFISGDLTHTFSGGIDPHGGLPNDSHTDLFYRNEGGVETNSDIYGGDTIISSPLIKVVTRLNLLDGRSFQFRYNPWGEVAEIIYPGGGVSRIDYNPVGSTACEAVGIAFSLNRRVTERRVFHNGVDGGTPDSIWTYVRDTNGTFPTVTVEAKQGGTNALLMSEKHFFLALDAQYGTCRTGTHNIKFENAREFKVERKINGSQIQTENRTWINRALQAWPAGNAYLVAKGQEQGLNDPRVTIEDMTLENGKLKRTRYDYDEFNNVTSIKEYDFGAGVQGNLLREIIRTFLGSQNGYCYKNLNGLNSSCNSSIAADPDDIIHNRRLLLTEEVKNGSGVPEAYTEAEYDNYQADANHAAIFPNTGMIGYNANRLSAYNANFQPRGNLTRIRRWIEGTTNADIYSFYDQAGNVVKVKDPLGRFAHYSYTDNFGNGSNPDSGSPGTNGLTFAFVTSITNPLSHTTKNQYDYTRGVVTGVKDLNLVVTRTEYDDYDRPIRIIDGDNKTGSEQAITETSYPTAAAVPGMPSTSWTRTSRQLDGTSWLSSATKYDGFGSPVEASQSEDGLHFNSANFTTNAIHTKTIYDGLGRVVKATNPYRDTLSTTDGWTRTTYDPAGRITEVATFSGSPLTPPPDFPQTNANHTGSVVTTYEEEKTTVRDQADKQRRSAVDGLGRLKTVEELNQFPASTTYASTSYSYDARGNLKQINQSTQTPRKFFYDGLSRLTRAENPESGAIDYTYDLASNLKTKQDARSITTTYSYDGLNRVTLKDYSNTTPDVTYTYDPAIANGKGRLSSVSSSVSNYNYTEYDALGRVIEYNQQTSGNLYPMSASYNKAGMLVSETYPSGKVIETQYDGAGRIAGVKDQAAPPTSFFAGGASGDTANRLQYTAHGAVSAMRLGNGLWEHTNFNSRFQPTQIGLGTTSTMSGVLQLDYTYNPAGQPQLNNGNIISQQIQAPGLNVTQTYSYDQANRLKTASEASNWAQTYEYDVYGNRWVNPSSTYIPNPSLTPQAQSAFNASNNRLQSSSYGYDPAGNLTKDPTMTVNGMVYDAENRMVSYTKPGVTATYVYDGDGRRVSKSDATGTLIFVYNVSGQLIAEYSTATPTGTLATSYLTTDHLGSTRVVTDQNQGVKARHDYLPFGEEIGLDKGGRSNVAGYTANDPTRQRFTSKERDAESGLDYFLARCYSSAQGRFTSPDEFTGGPDELFDFTDDASANPTFYADLTEPQSLNKYQYCFNNPLLYVDPDGHQGVRQWIKETLRGAASAFNEDNGLPAIKGAQTSVGRAIGHGTAILQGVTEVVGGGGIATGGTAGGAVTAPTIVGPVAGAAIATGGIIVAAHGGAVLINTGVNILTKNTTSQQSGSNPYSGQTDEQLLSSRDSYKGLITEHKQKLRDYRANPGAHDNKGLLKNAPTPEVREKIIKGRIKVLREQIRKQVRELRKIKEEVERRGLQ